MISKKIKLNIKDKAFPYRELLECFEKYKHEDKHVIEIKVDELDEYEISLLYPGKHVKYLPGKRKKKYYWEKMGDFKIQPLKNGVSSGVETFKLEDFVRDFHEYKVDNNAFWEALLIVYYTNELPNEIPDADGMDPRLFLLCIKWIYILEDMNYKYTWEEAGSLIPYKGVSGKAGRAKLTGSFDLARIKRYTLEELLCIIPLYG